MSSVSSLQLESNSKIKISFDGGDLSSDSGLLLIKEFAHKFGFNKHISQFVTDKNDSFRKHKDRQNLSQLIYQILARYFNDNDADELTSEQVFWVKRLLHHNPHCPGSGTVWMKIRSNSLKISSLTLL